MTLISGKHTKYYKLINDVTLYSSFVATIILGLKLLPKHSLGNTVQVPHPYKTTHKAT